MNPATYRIALAGLGNVGSSVLAILQREEHFLLKRYGVRFCVTGVAELGGCAIDRDGLDPGLLLEALSAGRPVAGLPGVGRDGMESIELLEQAQPDIFLEATPVNLDQGQPGLDSVRVALQKGIHAVLANKGPVALAYQELAALSDLGNGWGTACDATFTLPENNLPPRLRFSACVAGALPTINLGWRDLAGCRIQRLEAVFNGTTQYILRAMEEGQNYTAALSDAQQRGIAETDPKLDVDGWDAAAKLVITANAVLGQPCRLADIHIQGIRELDNETVQQAVADDKRIVLMCLAELVDGSYRLSVQPAPLPMDHPLARLTPDEMGVVFYTQDVERLSVTTSEPGAESASSAMIRDMLEIVRSEIKG